MEIVGKHCVLVSDTTDYSQITGTLGVVMSRNFLPIQLPYQGRTQLPQPTVILQWNFM